MKHKWNLVLFWWFFLSYLISSHWTMMECWWFPWKFLWKNVECTLNCLSWNITKKILTVLYTQSVILGKNIQKRYISLKNINKPKNISISRFPDVTIISWLVHKFIHIFEYKIGFHSKIKFHVFSEKYKHSSFHSNFKHKNIFSVLSRKWSTVTKRLSALAFRCSSESHVTSST